MKRPGLSLIEVLLALAILMMSLVAIGQLVGIGSENGLNERLTRRGTRLAEGKMNEIEIGAVALDAASSGGNFPDKDDEAWSWTCEVQPTGPPNLYQVTLKVTRDVRGTPFEITLGRLLYDPTKMGSAAQAERPATDSTDTTGGTSP